MEGGGGLQLSKGTGNQDGCSVIIEAATVGLNRCTSCWEQLNSHAALLMLLSAPQALL